jgi:hypothetical protein
LWTKNPSYFASEERIVRLYRDLVQIFLLFRLVRLMSHEVFYVNFCHSLNRTIIRHKITETLRRIYCWCPSIFHKISCYYAPLQAIIKSFEINHTFSSVLILVASILLQNTPSRWEKRLLFLFWKFFVSFHTKWKIFGSKNLSNFKIFYICVIWT